MGVAIHSEQQQGDMGEKEKRKDRRSDAADLRHVGVSILELVQVSIAAPLAGRELRTYTWVG